MGAVRGGRGRGREGPGGSGAPRRRGSAPGPTQSAPAARPPQGRAWGWAGPGRPRLSPPRGGLSLPPPAWARGRPGPVSGIVRAPGRGRSGRDVNKGVRMGDLRVFSLEKRRLRAELKVPSSA